MKRSYHHGLVLALAICLMISATDARSAPFQDEFSNWPDGASPQTVGKRVAENFIVRPYRAQSDPTKAKIGIIYPEVCTWYGALRVAQLTGDKDLQTRLIKKLDELMAPPNSTMISQSPHVDFRVFGTVPLEAYIQTQERKYLDLGKGLADSQWDDPTQDGITREARYWIDDMYMITAVQVQAYRATREAKYIDRAALAMSAYLDKLQQPNGLFYHALDTPFYWGRGNGWVAAGMTELLKSLPADHPRRPRILEGYRKMMVSLLKYQGEDGLWRQLIDNPQAWSETSGTGMFTFAMVTGVKAGWLDGKSYGKAARRGWLGLVANLDKDGNVANVCAGTNKLNDLNYYLNRPRNLGDLHGQAPILWSASALLAAVAGSADGPSAPAQPYVITTGRALDGILKELKPDNKLRNLVTGEGIGCRVFVQHEKNVTNNPAEVHDGTDDIFIIKEGTATLIIGGKLEAPTQAQPGEWRAAKISGGREVKVAKGDMIVVPRGTPHQRMTPGQEITLMVIKAFTPAAR